MKNAAKQPEQLSTPDDIHVVPQFGRLHEYSAGCWCGPRLSPDTMDRTKYTRSVWIHEVQQ